MAELNKPHWAAIEPLLHSNIASVVMHIQPLFTLIALLLECKEAA